MEGDPAQPGPHRRRCGRRAAPDDVASLIFTSGTTGTPKGVMLTHRNFASLVAKLAGAFDIGVGDGLLSVLPLHHTFEFSAGLPHARSARGAEITYIDELTADRLGDVLETGRVTAMIGVPALWQLLHRKITQELAAKPAIVEQAIKALMAAHGELRNRSRHQPGQAALLAGAPEVRRAASSSWSRGGSALPDEVHKAFHALGFNIAEGYGLTEAAPVLTRHRARATSACPGTVGRALPGIELRIDEPGRRRHRRGDRQRAQRDGRLLRGPRGHRRGAQGRLAAHRRPRAGWTPTGSSTSSGARRTSSSTPTGRTCTRTSSRSSTSDHAHIKELSIVGLPDDGGRREGRLPLRARLQGARRARRCARSWRSTSATSPPSMPFYRRVKVLRSGTASCRAPRTRKVKRKLVVEELQAAGAAGRLAARRRAAVAQPHGGVDGLAAARSSPRCSASRPARSGPMRGWRRTWASTR